MTERFEVHEQPEGWVILDHEDGSEVPQDCRFTYRPQAYEVAAKLNAVASEETHEH